MKKLNIYFCKIGPRALMMMIIIIIIIIIRINHECEGGIEKSVMRITHWYHEACQVMTNGDPKGLIFLSHPHTINELFFLLTIAHTAFLYSRSS